MRDSGKSCTRAKKCQLKGIENLPRRGPVVVLLLLLLLLVLLIVIALGFLVRGLDRLSVLVILLVLVLVGSLEFRVINLLAACLKRGRAPNVANLSARDNTTGREKGARDTDEFDDRPR